MNKEELINVYKSELRRCERNAQTLTGENKQFWLNKAENEKWHIELAQQLDEPKADECEIIRVDRGQDYSPRYIAVFCNKCNIKYSNHSIMKMMLNTSTFCQDCGAKIRRDK